MLLSIKKLSPNLLSYTISHISFVINGKAYLSQPQQQVEHLLTDSRKIVFPSTSLFFALDTTHKSGSVYIKELHEKGVTCFVVRDGFDIALYPQANFIVVHDALKALQQLATYHRKQFNIPVIGITGSNGKTIVKEWLYQLLHTDYNIVRSPKSYNSQIGVPLSIWQMNAQHTLAIFEAGISLPGEMELLEKIIQPTIGVITNIGEAHSAGFTGIHQKATKKFLLFKNAATIIYNADDDVINNLSLQQNGEKFSSGKNNATLQLVNINRTIDSTSITALYNNEELKVTIPFTDDASVSNAVSCWCLLLLLKISNDEIAKRMLLLRPIEMRLRLKKAVNNCYLINDSYSNDLSSLNIALDFLQQQSGNHSTTVILSDIADAGADMLYERVAQSLALRHLNRFIGIGPQLQKHRIFFDELLNNQCYYYESVDDFKKHFPLSRFKDEVILLKGARAFAFEQINLLFEQKVHQTVMEVNLNAMVHNLKVYQQLLKPSTKIMAMVKAFSYGSGSAEIANVLQYHKVDYLAVAYTDEGVELRKAGINMPILVMNPEQITFASIVEYDLEPELYSLQILNAFNEYLEEQGIALFPVHIKIDTGMHRLGFELSETGELINAILNSGRLVVRSVFSHLVASESQQHDDYTELQTREFIKVCDEIEKALGYTFLKHISNSAAIYRHPQMQLDMVRLGIGLYGVNGSASGLPLQTVATLKSTIAQVRRVAAGETIGYSRKGVLKQDSLIATVRIGYADGFSRKLGNGVGSMYVNGHYAKVVGNVCMDMTMIDVTNINNIKEGDEVEIFGAHLPIQQVAEWCETIPYEIMTGISQRVKRVYYEE